MYTTTEITVCTFSTKHSAALMSPNIMTNLSTQEGYSSGYIELNYLLMTTKLFNAQIFLKNLKIFGDPSCASHVTPSLRNTDLDDCPSILPDEDPKILGSQPRYEVGDVVNVTCRSGPSKPAAALKWYINGKEADMGMERVHAVEDHLDGLSTSSMGLVFRVRPTDLHQGGAVTLRCTATVSQTYSTTSEELIVGDRDPELASPPNPFMSERSSSSSSTQNGVRRIAPWSLLAILGWSSLMLL
ncbi:UNVERIFIED_CONTAM: hypothetical protein NCL1_50270 [Trichonephila clavipes]